MAGIRLAVNQCPYCGEKDVLRLDKFAYAVCTACGAGGEPPAESARERMRVILACARNDDVSNPVMAVKAKKTGSKRGKKPGGGKDKLQRATARELYNRLCSD